MLQQIVSIVTTAAVVFHALLGCCAHHAHACESHVDVSTALVLADTDSGSCCPCGHDNDDESSESEDGQQDGHGCNEPDCSFVTDQRDDSFGLDVWSSSFFVAYDIKVDSTPNIALLQALQPWCLFGDFSGPKLSRSVNQVWRI